MTTHIVVFDTETTSAKPATAKVVQLGAVLMTHHAGTLSQPRVLFNSLANPGIDIEEGASEVHGLYAKDLEWSPPSEWVIQHFYHALVELELTGDVILAGHNIEKFDIPVVGKRFADFHNIDTYTIAMRKYPAMQHKLTELYEWYADGPEVKAHDAAADCYMCSQILKRYLAENDISPIDLAKELEPAMVLSMFPWGKYKGKLLADIPHSYFKWCQQNFKDTHKDIDVTICAALGADMESCA